MFEVFHEGALQARVDSHNEAFAYVLDHQPQSFDWATRYETWRVEDRGNPDLDERDSAILAERRWRRITASCAAPVVGDYVRFADGKLRRISHHWDFPATADDSEVIDEYQTSDGGSFHLNESGLGSYSGSLYPSIPADEFTITGESQSARFWFFHHDRWTAHNGVDVWVEVPIWEVERGADYPWKERNEEAGSVRDGG